MKCDETKPACLNCKKRNIECGGYATNFKWRSFGETDSNSTVTSFTTSTKDKRTSISVISTSPTSTSASISSTASVPSSNLTSASSEQKSNSLKRHLELASLSVTGRTIDDIKIENDLISKGINPHSYKRKKHHSDFSSQHMIHAASVDSIPRRSNSMSKDMSPVARESLVRSFSTNSTMESGNLITSLREEYSRDTSARLDSLADAAVDEMNRSPSSIKKESIAESPALQLPFSPNFGDFLTVRSPAGSVDEVSSSHTDKAQAAPTSLLLSREAEILNEINLTPSLSAIINFAFSVDDPKDAFIDGKTKFPFEGPFSPLTLTFPYDNHENGTESSTANKQDSPLSFGKMALNMRDISSPVASVITPLSTIPDSQLNRSLVKTSEQEQILHLYSRYTCCIMSIKNGANENPWRNLIVPLATKYSCLFNSIASMTLFHLAGNSDLKGNGADMRAKGYIYLRRCILELASGLSKVNGEGEDNEELPADIALATCLNLAVCESWDIQTSSGIAHLKGAKSMIQKVLTLLRDQQQSLSKKRKELELVSSPAESEHQYNELVISKKKDLEKKLVLVEDNEWECLFEDAGSQEEPSGQGFANRVDKSSIQIPKSLQFLFNIWIYFEVLAQMTTDTNYDDKGVDLVATITTMLQTSQKNHRKKSGGSILLLASEHGDVDADTGSHKSDSGELSVTESITRNGFSLFENFDSFSYNTEYVDPLLGCAQSLFLIMGKVANLIAKIRKSRRKETESQNWKGAKPRNSLKTITLATELKQQLVNWKLTITASMINQANLYDDNNGNTWDLPSCIATAEAYRFATIIYLHQAVPEIPCPSTHSLAEKIFILFASIPTNSDLHVIHIFPLLVASCEAEPGDEREWCETRWKLLSEKMWIGNIDRALQVVKEVWKRKDDYKKKRRRGEFDEATMKGGANKEDEDSLRNISAQISGLMSVINDLNGSSLEDIRGGIGSKLHWSTVMKEWGWEVLLG